MKVKFCGFTTEEDVREADRLGADFVGFVLAKQSPRYVNVYDAQKLISSVKDAKTVVVCDSDDVDEINHIFKVCKPDYMQLHGNASLSLVRGLKMDLIQAFWGVQSPEVLDQFLDEGVEYVLIDKEKGQEKSDYSKLSHLSDRILSRTFVAGGVGGDDVPAIKRLNAFAGDMARSIESAPGKKDHNLMNKFISHVRS